MTPSLGAQPPAVGPTRFEMTHPALGTTFRVVVYCPDQASEAQAESLIIRRLAELDEMLDDARESSEISQLYANAGLGDVRVSDDLYSLLKQLDQFTNRSGAGYDFTAGPLTDLWKKSIEASRLPTDSELKSAKALTGRKQFRLDPINRTAHLTEPGMRLDLDGISKAYACDRVLSA